MAEFSEDSFENKLILLRDTQDSIQTLSTWCLKHHQHHKQIVTIWLKVLKKVKIEQRLSLFYLANDVIQHSKRKGFQFVDSWATALQRATPLVRDDKVRNKILRLLKIWDERHVYDESFIVDLSGLLATKTKKSTATVQDNNTDSIGEFQPTLLFNKIRMCKKLEENTAESLNRLKDSPLPVTDMTELRTVIKDRQANDDLLADLDDGIGRIDAYINALKCEIAERVEVIEILEVSEVFYDTQRGEAKIVCNAYRNFEKRVRHLKKELELFLASFKTPEPDSDHSKSPILSPDINAPSPTSDADLQFDDIEKYDTEQSFIGMDFASASAQFKLNTGETSGTEEYIPSSSLSQDATDTGASYTPTRVNNISVIGSNSSYSHVENSYGSYNDESYYQLPDNDNQYTAISDHQTDNTVLKSSLSTLPMLEDIEYNSSSQMNMSTGRSTFQSSEGFSATNFFNRVITQQPHPKPVPPVSSSQSSSDSIPGLDFQIPESTAANYPNYLVPSTPTDSVAANNNIEDDRNYNDAATTTTTVTDNDSTNNELFQQQQEEEEEYDPMTNNHVHTEYNNEPASKRSSVVMLAEYLQSKFDRDGRNVKKLRNERSSNFTNNTHNNDNNSNSNDDDDDDETNDVFGGNDLYSRLYGHSKVYNNNGENIDKSKNSSAESKKNSDNFDQSTKTTIDHSQKQQQQHQQQSVNIDKIPMPPSPNLSTACAITTTTTTITTAITTTTTTTATSSSSSNSSLVGDVDMRMNFLSMNNNINNNNNEECAGDDDSDKILAAAKKSGGGPAVAVAVKDNVESIDMEMSDDDTSDSCNKKNSIKKSEVSFKFGSISKFRHKAFLEEDEKKSRLPLLPSSSFKKKRKFSSSSVVGDDDDEDEEEQEEHEQALSSSRIDGVVIASCSDQPFIAEDRNYPNNNADEVPPSNFSSSPTTNPNNSNNEHWRFSSGRGDSSSFNNIDESSSSVVDNSVQKKDDEHNNGDDKDGNNQQPLHLLNMNISTNVLKQILDFQQRNIIVDSNNSSSSSRSTAENFPSSFSWNIDNNNVDLSSSQLSTNALINDCENNNNNNNNKGITSPSTADMYMHDIKPIESISGVAKFDMSFDDYPSSSAAAGLDDIDYFNGDDPTKKSHQCNLTEINLFDFSAENNPNHHNSNLSFEARRPFGFPPGSAVDSAIITNNSSTNTDNNFISHNINSDNNSNDDDNMITTETSSVSETIMRDNDFRLLNFPSRLDQIANKYDNERNENNNNNNNLFISDRIDSDNNSNRFLSPQQEKFITNNDIPNIAAAGFPPGPFLLPSTSAAVQQHHHHESFVREANVDGFLNAVNSAASLMQPALINQTLHHFLPHPERVRLINFDNLNIQSPHHHTSLPSPQPLMHHHHHLPPVPPTISTTNDDNLNNAPLPPSLIRMPLLLTPSTTAANTGGVGVGGGPSIEEPPNYEHLLLQQSVSAAAVAAVQQSINAAARISPLVVQPQQQQLNNISPIVVPTEIDHLLGRNQSPFHGGINDTNTANSQSRMMMQQTPPHHHEQQQLQQIIMTSQIIEQQPNEVNFNRQDTPSPSMQQRRSSSSSSMDLLVDGGPPEFQFQSPGLGPATRMLQQQPQPQQHPPIMMNNNNNNNNNRSPRPPYPPRMLRPPFYGGVHPGNGGGGDDERSSFQFRSPFPAGAARFSPNQRFRLPSFNNNDDAATRFAAMRMPPRNIGGGRFEAARGNFDGSPIRGNFEPRLFRVGGPIRQFTRDW